MLIELFAFTGMVFFGWFILGAFVLIAALDNEQNPWRAFWATVALVGLPLLFTDLEINLSFTDYLLLGLAYWAVGAVHGLLRWFLLVRSIRQRYDEMQTNEVLANGDFDPARKLASEFRADGYDIEIPPQPGQFTARLGSWINFWPVCIASYLLFDALAALGRTVRESLSGVMTRISKAAWGE